jgi:hypothetical protein
MKEQKMYEEEGGPSHEGPIEAVSYTILLRGVWHGDLMLNIFGSKTSFHFTKES